MTLEWFLYLAHAAEGIITLAIVCTIVLAIICAVVSCVYLAEKEWEEGWPYIKRLLCWTALAGALTVFVPSERTLYLMAGASVGRDVLQSETGRKVKQLVDKKLDELITEEVKK